MTDDAEPEHGKDGPVAEAHVGREARARLHFAREHAGLELRQRPDQRTVVLDQRGDAVVRRAQHRAPALERTHAADVEVLVRRGRVAEPGVVGHVDEQRGLAHQPELLGTVGVFIADRRREDFARRPQRRRIGASRLEIGIRQVHEPQPFAHGLRHREEFTEGNEPSLVVPLHGLVERPGRDRVVVRARGSVAPQQPHQQRRAVLVRERGHLREVRAHVFLEGRNRGLRPHDHVHAEVRHHHVRVQLHRVLAVARFPLHRLRHGTLHQRCADRRTARHRPFDARQCGAGAPDAQDDDGSDDAVAPLAEQQTRPVRPR